MPGQCAVKGCKSFYRVRQNLQAEKVHSFKFPDNPTLRKKWMKEIGINSISKDCVVCQDHFLESYFVPKEEKLAIMINNLMIC